MDLRSSKHLEVTAIVHYSPGKIEGPFLCVPFANGPRKFGEPSRCLAILKVGRNIVKDQWCIFPGRMRKKT